MLAMCLPLFLYKEIMKDSTDNPTVTTKLTPWQLLCFSARESNSYILGPELPVAIQFQI